MRVICAGAPRRPIPRGTKGQQCARSCTSPLDVAAIPERGIRPFQPATTRSRTEPPALVRHAAAVRQYTKQIYEAGQSVRSFSINLTVSPERTGEYPALDQRLGEGEHKPVLKEEQPVMGLSDYN